MNEKAQRIGRFFLAVGHIILVVAGVQLFLLLIYIGFGLLIGETWDELWQRVARGGTRHQEW